MYEIKKKIIPFNSLCNTGKQISAIIRKEMESLQRNPQVIENLGTI